MWKWSKLIPAILQRLDMGWGSEGWREEMKKRESADAGGETGRSGERGWGETGPWAGAGVAAEPCEGDGAAVGVGGGAGERADWGVGGVWEEEV